MAATMQYIYQDVAVYPDSAITASVAELSKVPLCW